MADVKAVGYFMSVTPAVKKYLKYWMPVKFYLGTRKPSMYMATQDDLVGMWLINAFTRKTKQVKELSISDAKQMGYTELWPFAIPIRYQENLLLPERRVPNFNNMIIKMMYFEMLSDMEIMRSKGNVFHIQQAINDFRLRYDLYEKEFTDERIRKLYLRWRVRNNTIRSECGSYLPGMLLGKIS